MTRSAFPKLFLGFVATAIVGLLAFFGLGGQVGVNGQTEVKEASKANSRALEEIPFDGAAAFKMLEQVCNIGPRVSGTEGMARQQELLQAHFTKLGGRVRPQPFTARDPRNGSPVKMANLYVEWHPDRKSRILLCAHYDTRPYPDQDPIASNRRKPFIGANDGGSGVALLAELGRHMKDLDGPVGVDFVLFDGEEYVFDNADKYFLGSEHFAQQYIADPPAHRYVYGILFDMIGDKDLQIYQERNSMSWRETRALVQSIWKTAAKLGVREFIPRQRHVVNDDHIPLNKIARIPTCDLIDFDYPNPKSRLSYWHTIHDTADKCSDLSLAKVGWVTLEWLKELQAQQSPEKQPK